MLDAIQPRSWFTVTAPVDRMSYALVGLGLATLKYALEAIVVYAMSGQAFGPLDFVNPWLSTRAPFLTDSPVVGVFWLLFTIPFAWIAIAMSVRRAADIGISPWVGLFVLIPLLNLAVMSLLALLPQGVWRVSPEEQARLDARQARVDAAFAAPVRAPNDEDEFDNRLIPDPSGVQSQDGIAAVLAGCLVQVVVGGVSVWLLEMYGFILFFSSPVIAGTVMGFIYNHRWRASKVANFGYLVVMNILSFTVMLFVGLDGAICLAMAFPLLAPLSFLGVLLGRALATAGLRPGRDERGGAIGTMLLLPLCLILEPLDRDRPLHAVTTTVDIAATPDVVWQQVIAFPEIEGDLEWFFRLGIAAPVRARIEGTGVGACRYCEFTTGPFVEPITVWQPPERLAFDVVEQPHPMREWSPLTHLHPPHLDNAFVSRRGEFRLERLADGGTRLHGTTWYDIDVRPRMYWKIWSDGTIHAIHRRVLNHIAKVSEADAN